MAVVLHPLCSQGKVVSRDGNVGRNAHIMLPFYQYGYYFFGGQQYDFSSGEVGQDHSMATRGTRQSAPFVKAYGVCS